MGIEAKWKSRGIRVGKLPCGPLDKISDVPGVTVGHCTLADGEVQTGVTALLPHQGDIFHDKVMAASHVINGFGKTTGLVQIDELGTLETPILFTNTLSVGTVETALVKYMLDKNPDARICVSAIALETLSAAVAALTAKGRTVQVSQIAVSRAKAVGGLHLMMAQNPIYLITGE
jgi:L-aminopeptidase/D-esterase-like protein